MFRTTGVGGVVTGAAVTAPSEVTNLEFLKTIFCRRAPRALLVSFPEAPADAPRARWNAKAARWGVSRLPSSSNNYFCISIFKQDKNGDDRRQAELFDMGCVVVLDDVGTKMIAAEALKLLGRPTYRLETSTGNEQLGYCLDPPCTNREQFAALVHGLTKTSINPSGDDPGMKGVTRMVRLPKGRNTKAEYGPGGFEHRLLEWAPERTFTVEGLAAGAGIDLNAGVKAKGSFVSRPLQPGERDVWRGGLAALGMVKECRPDGTLDITCPYVDEHTGGEDSGTVRMPRGGFKCHHGHCSKRSKQDFHDRIKRRLREDGQGDLVARLDFEDADKPALDALWGCLERGEKPSRENYDAVAYVPKAEMDRHLAPATVFLGTDLKPIRAGLARARGRFEQAALAAARRAKDRANKVLPLPAGYIAPVPLAEAQAANCAAMERHMAAMPPGPLRPMPRALRRQGF